MEERRVTLADVARRAGVHVTTVSLALRDRPRLPEATRRRIQALARDMGYAPDPFLHALVPYRSPASQPRREPVLAYLTNWHTPWGWKEVPAHRRFFAGAEAKALELGFRLEHFWTHDPARRPEELGETLQQRGIQGVILASHSRDVGDALQLDWERFSAVKIDYFPHYPPLHNVTNSQSRIIRLAVRKTAAMGYRKIGFVVHRGWDHAVDHNWTAGFLCEQSCLPDADRVPIHVFPGARPVARWFNEKNASVRADHAPLERWLERHRPEVVISKGDYVLPVFAEMGVRIPEDFAFVNLFLDPPDGTMAGVRQNHETVGELAVETLVGQLIHNKFGVPSIPTTTFVEGTWFDGASCPPLPGVAASGDRGTARGAR